MKRHWTARALRLALAAGQVLAGVPVFAETAAPAAAPAPESAASASEAAALSSAAAPPAPPKVKVNRTVPRIKPVAPLAFSKEPLDVEFLRLHVLDEGLVPLGGATTPTENAALAEALNAYRAKPDVKVLESFLSQHPDTRWRGSLLTNVGLQHRRTGYYTRALREWREAWDLAKNE